MIDNIHYHGDDQTNSKFIIYIIPMRETFLFIPISISKGSGSRIPLIIQYKRKTLDRKEESIKEFHFK